MSYGALQGGGRRAPLRRTRGRVWRRIGLSILGAFVLGAVLLGLMAAGTAGPTRVIVPRHPTRTHPAAALRSPYGTVLAPPSERVDLRLRRGLRSGLLFDVSTGQILWERDATRVLPIASLTKMMTALVVVEHSNPRDRVLITPAAVHFTGSGVGLLPVHKHVSELALLYGLLLPSGNDAAIALAQHVAATQQGLITMMNAQAHELGLSCTHFTTVSGIVDRGNHSCGADLALLAHLVLDQPLLSRIVGSRSAVLPFPIKGRKLYLYNNNPLLIVGYPGADGVKTGYTEASGPCLVATARRGKTWLGVVLLHSQDTLDQAERLLNAGFAKLRGRV